MTAEAPYRPIVVGLDESVEGRFALNWAVDEAAGRGLPLRLLVVYGGPSTARQPHGREAVPAPAQDLLDKAIAAAGDRIGADRVTGVLIEGRPAQVLLDESDGAELIVVGSRPRSTLASIVLGSVSSAVAAHARCPVVVARQGSEFTEERVTVGVDGSTHSENALAFAFSEADVRGLPLDVVHCWQAVEMIDPAVWTGEMVEEHLSERQDWLDELVDRHRAGGRVSTSTHVVEGRAAVQLTERSRSTSLLVVGSRGHGGVAGLVMGSVSQSLLHHAHCPVAVVHER